MNRMIMFLFFTHLTIATATCASADKLRGHANSTPPTNEQLISAFDAFQKPNEHNPAFLYASKTVQITMHIVEKFFRNPENKRILEVLSQMSFLKKINISLNYQRRQKTELLLEVLASLPREVPWSIEFFVEEDIWRDHGLEYLAKEVFPELATHETLSCIKFSRIKVEALEKTLEDLADSLGSRLNGLAINECYISETMLNTINKFTALRKLKITKCNLRKIPTAVSTLAQLTKCDFSYNDLSTDDFEIFHRITPQLHTLCINFCNLTKIPTPLSVCRSLRVLHCAGNPLNETSWNELSLDLQRLNISETRASLDAIIPLAQRLDRVDAMQNPPLNQRAAHVFSQSFPRITVYLS